MFSLRFFCVLLFSISFGLASTESIAGPDISKLKLAPGFRISVYAEGVTSARSLALSPSGTLFVGTFAKSFGGKPVGKVYAIKDTDGDNRAEQVTAIASGLNYPNGVALYKGDLYVAEIDKVLKFADIERNLNGKAKAQLITDVFPSEFHHGWKFIHFSPTGKLYVPVGAPCNICERAPDEYANIQRFNSDGSGGEVFARGVRNSVGFDWHPETGELWFTDNGRDMMGDELPSDELNHAPEAGLHFGYPYCHQGDIPDPELAKDKNCADFRKPVAKLGPHVAALGMQFYTGKMFPEKYRNQPFIALHGSWNRTPEAGHTGGKLVVAHLRDGELVEYETIVDGWLGEDNKFFGRPVDMEVMRDGSMLISDDHADVIYRLWYEPDPDS